MTEVRRVAPGQIAYALVAVALVALAATVKTDGYVANILTQAATYAIAVFGLSIVLGLCGQINLAQAAFFALGAYSVALGTVDYRLPFWLCLLGGMALACAAGAVLGLSTLRLGGHYLAIVIARTFQNIRLFRSMTALENVVIGAERDGNALVEGGPDALLSRARAALDFVGLGNRANETIPSFSYGHQRLIEIARALAANPTVLLLDEPGAGLNSSEKKALHDLLNRIVAQGLTILIIDHDMTLIAGVAKHLTVLNFGRRIADGGTVEVLRQPDVVAAYLGVS